MTLRQEVDETVRALSSGRFGLHSMDEDDVADWMASGLSAHEIATALMHSLPDGPRHLQMEKEWDEDLTAEDVEKQDD